MLVGDANSGTQIALGVGALELNADSLERIARQSDNGVELPVAGRFQRN